MKPLIKKRLYWFAGIFVALFLFRFIHGFISYPASGQRNNIIRQRSFQIANYNIASTKVKVVSKAGAQPTYVDQKYERVADIKCRSTAFKKDEQKVRSTIKEFRALVQQERRSGLTGRRSLYLAIGVAPGKFDSMVAAVEKIGRILSKRISKKDKTNEYKDLNAKKKSLLQIRANLLGLKNRGGKIAEFISLENRILEIEEQIQKLGVRLGEFDAENEFCTIKFALLERPNAAGISLLQRIKVALEWTLKFYIIFLGILFLAVLISLLLTRLLEKMKLLQQLAGDDKE